MYIDSVDFLFHDLTAQEADELFRLAQLEVFDRISSSLFAEYDKHPLLAAWIKVASMQDSPASFHLTFPSRALISVAAHYKAKSIHFSLSLTEAEDWIPSNNSYWEEKRKKNTEYQ